MVTTIDSTVPSAERIGVALTSVVTLRPSGTVSVISSARTVSGLLSCSAIGNSARVTSRPSPRRQVITSSSSSTAPPGIRRRSTIRRASRLNDTGLPLPPSKTTTPTGEVSTRASRSALARRSSRCVRALAMAVAALRREQDQNLLVGARELRSALLLAEKEVADVHVAVAHGRALHRLRHDQLGREAEFPDIGRQVGHSQRLPQVPEVLEQAQPVGPRDHCRVLAGRQAGADEVLRLSGVVDRRDQAVAGAGQRAGAVDDLPQDGLEVEAGADAQDGCAQVRDAVLERLDPSTQFIGTLLHYPLLAGRGARLPAASCHIFT